MSYKDSGVFRDIKGGGSLGEGRLVSIKTKKSGI